MKRFRFAALLLMTAAGCAAPASDAVLVRGAALDTLPDAWFSWRNEPRQSGGKGGPYDLSDGRIGLLLYADGRAEAVTKPPPIFAQSGGGTQRGSGVVSAADRAELEKAAAGPLSPSVPQERKVKGDLEPETEGRLIRYVVEIRGADGAVRRVSYEHREEYRYSSGGEPLHPLVMRILKGLLD